MSVGLYTDMVMMDDMYDSENATNDNLVTSPGVPLPVLDAASIFTGVLLVLLSIVTVAGNIGTIWAFRSNILLRQKPSNLLILSLSCCDLAVGATGLPVAAVHTGLGYWPLGKPVCIISAFFSVIGVSAGMYTVTAISVDRWLLVSREYPSYLRIQSSRNVKLQIAGAWIAAILISSCETILWVVHSTSKSVVEETIDYSLQCISPVRSDSLFILVIFVLLFAIPFLVMVLSTLRFVVLLRRRLRKSRTRTMSVVSSNNVIANIKREPSVTSSVDNSVYDNNAFDDRNKNPTASKKPKVASQASVTFDKKTPSTGTNSDSPAAQTQRPVKHPSLSQTGRAKSFFGLGSDASLGASRNRRALKLKNRYMKPAVRLAILLGVFALCTLPYPIFIILSGDTLVEARNHLSNLLLSNSGLNPFLYAIMHRKIRLFYISKLTPPCCRKRNM